MKIETVKCKLVFCCFGISFLIGILIMAISYPMAFYAQSQKVDRSDLAADVETIDKGSLNRFLTQGSQDAITRSHTCSISIEDACFAEVRQGNFIMDLQLSFESWEQGSTSPTRSEEKRFVFKDLIKLDKASEILTFPMSNKKLVDNTDLGDKTNLRVTINLVEVTEEQQKLLAVVNPLLDQVLQFAPASNVLNNILRPSGDKPSQNPVPIFETSFDVPLNIVEYANLNKQNRPLLKNDAVYGFVVEGQKNVKLAYPSLSDNLKTFVNSITFLVGGKKVIKKEDLSFWGIIKLRVTRNENQLLPPEIQTKLNEVDQIMRLTLHSSVQSRAEAALDATAKLADLRLSDSGINRSVFNSIVYYLDICKTYLAFKSKNVDWKPLFREWTDDIRQVGPLYNTKVFTVTGIYDKGLGAPIFVPYSLPDDLTIRLSNYQVTIHESLKKENNSDFSVPVTQKQSQ